VNPSHSIDLDTDENDWWWATCACGWQEGPFPGQSDAGDAWAEHVQDEAPR